MKKRLYRFVTRHFRAYWPIGLFAYYTAIALSFRNIPPADLSQLFGLVLVLCGAVAWLVNDYVRESDDRVQSKLEEISDLLAPYDGMKLSEMPQDVQDEVRRRLGWVTPPAKEKPQKTQASNREAACPSGETEKAAPESK